jgi:hypothetical protein
VIGTSVHCTGPSAVSIVWLEAPDTPYCRSICWASVSREHEVNAAATADASASAVNIFMISFSIDFVLPRVWRAQSL